MVAPPPTIMHPRIIWRVIKGSLCPGQRKAGSSEERVLPQRAGWGFNPR